MRKKLVLLFVCMMTTVWCFAQEQSGTCGENLKWSLIHDWNDFENFGILTISGTGEMTNYGYNESPWYGKAIYKVFILEGVTSIGDNAFYGCTAMNKISLPNSLISIGIGAFCWCSNLKTIFLSRNVKKLSGYAFDYSFLQSIEVDNVNPFYSSEDGVLFNKNKNELVSYPQSRAGSYTIPYSVTSTAPHAFSYYSSYDCLIEFPSSVKNIGENAFFGSYLRTL